MSLFRIKLSTQQTGWPWFRQTPGGLGQWGNYQFVLDQDISNADFWVVFEDITKAEFSYCPRNAVIFVAAEPDGIKHYNSRFLSQFAYVITCQEISHPGLINTQPGLPWHVGVIRRSGEGGTVPFDQLRYSYDDYAAMSPLSKNQRISVISSSKISSEGHRARLQFIETLQTHFGDRLHVFGKGICPIPDKWEALAPYKYHIALENCSRRNYWTEKLADAYLGWCYPIYYGCLNLKDYFPPNSYFQIDITRPEQAIRDIERILEEDTFEQKINSIRIARDLVLNKYNFFACIADYCSQLSPGKAEKVCIRPESDFKKRGNVKSFFKRGLNKVQAFGIK